MERAIRLAKHMISLHITIDDNTSMEELQAHMHGVDAYCALSAIRNYLSRASRKGYLFGDNKEMNDSHYEAVDKIIKKVNEIVEDLPGLDRF